MPDTDDNQREHASPFLTDVAQLRARARANIEDGPVTDAYGADLPRVIDVLQQVLATEIVCVLRYRQHHYAAQGMSAEPIAAEFLAHSVEEQGHADLLSARISQLGAAPDLDPSTLTSRSHAEYRTAGSLEEMVRENLVAERIAIASYTAIINWLGSGDPTTRRVLEEILAIEEEHADDLSSMLDSVKRP
jgi:bacterioferritin